jgi:hypothetical protein
MGDLRDNPNALARCLKGLQGSALWYAPGARLLAVSHPAWGQLADKLEVMVAVIDAYRAAPSDTLWARLEMLSSVRSCILATLTPEALSAALTLGIRVSSEDPLTAEALARKAAIELWRHALWALSPDAAPKKQNTEVTA